MEHLIFTNARVIQPDSVLEHGRVSVRDGIIESVDREGEPGENRQDARVIDCGITSLPASLIPTVTEEAVPISWMEARRTSSLPPEPI